MLEGSGGLVAIIAFFLVPIVFFILILRQAADPGRAAMGLQIVSFIIRDLHRGYGDRDAPLFTVDEMVDREGEVITAIPEGETGLVAFLANGQPQSIGAQSVDGKGVAQGRRGVIEQVLAHVRQKT